MKQQSRLSEILVQVGAISQAQSEQLRQEQEQWGGRLAHLVIELGFIREDQLVRLLSQELRLPVIPLDRLMRVPPEALSILPATTCERFEVLPVGIDARQKKLQLAMSDPTEQSTIEELQAGTGLEIDPLVSSAPAIRKSIRLNFYGEGAPPQHRSNPPRGTGSYPQAGTTTPVPMGSGVHNAPRSRPPTGAHPSIVPQGGHFRMGWQGAGAAPSAASHPASLELDAVPSQVSLPKPVVRPNPQSQGRSSPPSSAYATAERHMAHLLEELQTLRGEYRQLKETTEQELHDMQALLRSRFEEQRNLMRGLFDLLVSRGYVSKEELVDMLNRVAELQDKGK